MTSSLSQKLQLKVGQALAALNAPVGYADRLTAEMPEISVTTQGVGATDAALFFVTSLADAVRLMPDAAGAIKPGGLLWIAYPKGSSGVTTDVNRDRLWEALKPTGWRPVRQIALDEVWSAMRFRPAGEVGS